MTSFDQLFTQYYQEIYGYLLRVCPEDVDDLVQETFLVLYQQHKQLEPEGIRAWLYRVAMNKSLDWMRTRKRRLKRELEVGESYAGGGVDCSNPEHAALFHLTMRRLEPRQQQLLCLHHAGLSYEELAKVLEVSRASISQLLVRAKREFAEMYKILSLNNTKP